MYSNALNGIDTQVMKDLSVDLVQHYREYQSWDNLMANRPHWEGIVNRQFFTTFFALMEKAKKRLGDDYSGSYGSPPPNNGHAANANNGHTASANNEAWEFPFGTFLQRLSLLDKNKKILIEADIRNKETQLHAIKMDGQVIGWLEVGTINVDILPLAEYFFQQQVTINTWAALLGALVAVLLSLLFSRHITAPIKSLTLAAKRIAKRDYQNPVSVRTKDELFELAQSFNAISKELKHYEDRQKQWLMDISHELRTPITILMSEISAICEQITRCDIQAVESLQQEVMQIKRLVDDLHDLSKLEEVGFCFQTQHFDLQELVNPHIKYYTEPFADRQIALRTSFFDAPIIINGDPDRISQVIRNLLENCLRYTQSPGVVVFKVGICGDYVELIVEDSGPGVSSADLPKLFDRLYRAEASRNRVKGGAGLGLTICQEIINAHGGKIMAEHSPLGGLTIKILLKIIGN